MEMYILCNAAVINNLNIGSNRFILNSLSHPSLRPKKINTVLLVTGGYPPRGL